MGYGRATMDAGATARGRPAGSLVNSGWTTLSEMMTATAYSIVRLPAWSLPVTAPDWPPVVAALTYGRSAS